ncbi:MAG: hydrocarbon degradation protein [Chlorobi bacterium]|nr:hydrocarbon degradation protein [Chlorobiota bacterium]
MKKIIFFLGAVFLATTVMAGGYQVRLQGNKQTGFGLVGTPMVYGASSNFYNPGSLSFMKKKWDFDLGASFILSSVAFQKSESNYQAESDNPVSTPFYFYGAFKINKLITVGLGVYTPYGSSAVWNDDWAGRLLIQNISLSAIFIQPTISFNINDKLGIGAGFVYAIGNISLRKALNYSGDSYVDLEGKASNIGFNVGLYWQALDNLSFGIDYRSAIKMSVTDGDATFSIPTALQGTLPPSNKFDAELPLPANLDFGVAFNATDKLTFALEVDWVMWSAYDTLSFKFKEKGELLNSDNPRLYKDTFIPRLGIEYKVSDLIHVRGGFYYDPTPTNADYFSPETVSLNNIAYTLGLSIMPVEGLSIDISWLQLFGQKADKNYSPDNFGGTYKNTAIVPGLGISYSF